ncbi:MAG: divergent PAP2 family protein [Christensenellaceae bacterium]|nr:divergent PAP2 family protein [Christensenellaceae bacterium]
MHYLGEVLQNDILICSLISWAVAQGLKVPFMYLTDKKWNIKRFWGPGGMPSSHTALVVTLSIMIGSIHGFDTVEFAISSVFATVVMYDAAGVRRQTGTQASVINEIVNRIFIEGEKITEKDLKEIVGHTPIEVFAGVLVGIAVSLIYLMFF